MEFHRTRRIYFVGIGGVGMSGIAEVLLKQGYEVHGSDIKISDRVRRLRERGAIVHKGHDPENVREADVVVQTSAVGSENPEIKQAHKLGIPVIPRAEMLAELMRLKKGIAVAGTHGKTTTTAMLSSLFDQADRDSTVVVGGRLRNEDIGAHLGDGEEMIVEADESDGTFLYLRPIFGIVTNIENDHLDYYDSMEDMEETFLDFINSIPFYGSMVLCGEDGRIRSLLSRVKKPYLTYGFSHEHDLYATDVEATGTGMRFTLHLPDRVEEAVELGVPGRHNVLNALAAVGIALERDIPIPDIRAGLSRFEGVRRRFDLRGAVRGTQVYDDYAHHPTEITTTLRAARSQFPDRELIAVFQPHRYSRTRDLAGEFGEALNVADRICVMDIYPAGEDPIEGIDLEYVRRRVEPALDGSRSAFLKDREEVLHWVEEQVEEDRDQVLFTLGAGDVGELAEPLLNGTGGRSS